ncbi:glucosaminidase domain-containing protein [Cohnella sp. WQ 127256]|uniref:glucosaminidase domain-containing protein n=1 Tax=Cohnella sp. WQ 127256 TaxID=2938790 RepID=UPI002118526D|nr:glucosaminidase domain-containing protein [Cohnella sp. WQ 127256]
MRRKGIQKLIAYVLGLALILTLGMRTQPSQYEATRASSSSIIPQSHMPISFVGASIAPNVTDPTDAPNQPGAPEPPKAGSIEDSQASNLSQQSMELALVEDIAKNQENEVHISAASQEMTYEVTAYYLNVRANPFPKSKILNVVKKGTLLEIVSMTDKGWLRIKGGGYVHGDYAKLISGENLSIKPIQKEADQPVQLEDPTTRGDSIEPAEPADAVDPEQSEEIVKPSSAVETDSGLNEEDISAIFDGTALAGHGLEEAILEVEEEYGINALFTIAVMKLESGNGSSRLAKNKNNLFGLNASGKDAHNRAYSFETKGDSVRKFGQLLAKNYVGKGYTTIEKISTKYCPANSKWSGLVKNIMKKDYKKLNVI